MGYVPGSLVRVLKLMKTIHLRTYSPLKTFIYDQSIPLSSRGPFLEMLTL